MTEGLFGVRFFLGKGAYFCVTKSTKSQQRRAFRPPLQTSAHLRECAAGSMRAGKVRLLGAKKNPAERKSKLFLISKSALSARMIRYICGIFLSPVLVKFRVSSLPVASALSRERTQLHAKIEQIRASDGAGGSE